MLSEERLSELLENLRNLRILVVGDVILDTYLSGRVERISPEAPVPVLEVEGEEFRLGGAGNVARNLRSLGVNTVLCGVVGRDHYADILKSLMENEGIEAFLVEDERPTTRKTRVVSRNQQLLRIDWESRQKVEGRTLKSLLNFVESEKADGVIVSDYAKGVVTRELMKVLRERFPFISVDPRPQNKPLYIGVNLVTPNEKELKAMTGEGSVEELGRKLKEELSLGTLVVTRGEKGMTLFREEIKHFPARARKVYDVTGAGDTVIASLTAFVLGGASWEEACELANLAAGIVVGEFGTASVSPERLKEELIFYQKNAADTA
ncbi:MAG: D-glycero-beta-D-manno-heptose-7-phosphate kinase [Aquificae bacterium]|nr:D-glycero-beta-D-manno-heptose-7-phosphate kinase [Aquificota bacterium]